MKKILLIASAMTLLSFVSCNASADISYIDPISTSNEISDNEEKEDIILTMAGRGFSVRYRIGNENMIDRFNEMDNGYKIIVVDYGDYYDAANEEAAEAWVDRDRELILDVMNGGIVDIVPNVFNDSGKYVSLAEKGAFADLNEFIENDPQIDDDMLFTHVLETTEINGQLTYMPLSFTIKTLIGKTKYVGDKENWTMEDLKRQWEKVSDKIHFSYNETRDKVYYSFLRGNLNSFIDYENAECHFDSEEFINLLDFINTFDEPLTYKTEPEFDDIFIYEAPIYGFDAYHSMLWNENNDDMTFVGYPSNNGTGAMLDISGEQIAISAFSSPEKQKGAWEFIKLLLSEEYQSEIMHPQEYIVDGTLYSFGGDMGFPINYNVFQKQGEEQYINEGKEKLVEYPDRFENIGYLKKSEYDRLVAYINDIKISTSRMEDELKNIIEDELFAMFRNEQTSTEAANNIQKRISLLVSERYG